MNKYTRVMLLAVFFISMSLVVQAGSIDPGSAEDPLVTKSYVDERIQALRSELGGSAKTVPQEQVAVPSSSIPSKPTAPETSTPTTSDSFKYNVLKLQKGQKLLGGDGTEIIVRTGKAVAIGNAGGNGLPDVTSGVDVKDGVEVKLNHLLLVPSKDGRGIRIIGEGDTYVMVRGAFEIR